MNSFLVILRFFLAAIGVERSPHIAIRVRRDGRTDCESEQRRFSTGWFAGWLDALSMPTVDLWVNPLKANKRMAKPRLTTKQLPSAQLADPKQVSFKNHPIIDLPLEPRSERGVN